RLDQLLPILVYHEGNLSPGMNERGSRLAGRGGRQRRPPTEYLAVPAYTRRRLRGRQPLCGIGVTSRIAAMVKPTACSALSGYSRAGPGPLTSTSRDFMPCCSALRRASSAATWAA